MEKSNSQERSVDSQNLLQNLKYIYTMPNQITSVESVKLSDWQAFVEELLCLGSGVVTPEMIKQKLDWISAEDQFANLLLDGHRYCVVVLPSDPEGNILLQRDIDKGEHIVLLKLPLQQGTAETGPTYQELLYNLQPVEIQNECSFEVHKHHADKAPDSPEAVREKAAILSNFVQALNRLAVRMRST